MAARLIRVDSIGPAYAASCVCGWWGPNAATRDDARRHADAHREARHRTAVVDAARQRRHRGAVECSG